MLRHIILAFAGFALVLCVGGSGGCKRLPNPETDEVSRVMRTFDRLHRPDGHDLPLERYFAWAANRDAGLRPASDMTEELQALANDQRSLVVRIRGIRTTSSDALSILEGYLGAHIDAHLAMEEVLVGRRLGDPMRAEKGEAAVKAALDKLRVARENRKAIEAKLGIEPATAETAKTVP